MKQEIILGDCLEKLKGFPDNYIDLTVTSPPYDNLRSYENSLNWTFEIFQKIAKELFRITKDGGVIVWVVGDATQNGSETGTSFKQALYFKEIGFNLHDTMIWFKPNAMPQVDKSRFTQSFEYMFVMSRGKPKTAKPLMVPTKNAGKVITRLSRNIENINKSKRIDKTNDYRIAFNVHSLCVGSKSFGHPAIFPEQLARDHIISWTNENDIVLDPFAGSGTVGKMAKQLNRQFILIEKEPKYYDIILKRLNE